MIRAVTMYQAVCDGCGNDIYDPCFTEEQALGFVIKHRQWKIIKKRLLCQTCQRKQKEKTA